MRRIGGRLTLIGALMLGLPGAARADDAAALKAEVDALEQENRALEAELNSQRELTERLSRKISQLEGKDESLLKEVRRVAEKPMMPIEEIETSALPKLTIKGFADHSYNLAFSPSGEVVSQFDEGVPDFFFLAGLTDRASILIEWDFHFHDNSELIHGHLERTQIRYAFSDLMNLTVGVGHTPLGYWNETYHHGSWLQTTIDRPDMYLFERPNVDKGGILPNHSTGLELGGVFPFELADVNYNFGLYNGRPRVRNGTAGSGSGDNNDFKAVNVLLSLQPHAVPGLRLGGNVYVDRIPNTGRTRAAGGVPEDIDEFILGGHVTYVHEGTELLFELFNINHDNNDLEQTFKTLAGYVQGSYQMGKFTPYYRMDLIDLGNGDPFYDVFSQATGLRTKSNPILDHHKQTLGLRWDVFSWNALKFEYSYTGNNEALDEHRLAVNTSYAF